MNRLSRLLGKTRNAIVLLALTFSSLAFGAGPVLDRVVEGDVLKVAMSGDQQPFNFVFGKNDKIIGFDVDLAREIAQLMGVELQIVRMPFDELIGAVEDGRADLVISGMTITASRTRGVTFIGPYMLSGKSLLANAKTVQQMKSPDELNRSSVKLVALKGSTSESLIQRKLPEATLTSVGNYDEGIKLLLTGAVNGMVADMPILALTKQQHRDANLQLITPPLSIEPLGIMIARGDEQLENLLRNYLAVFEKTGLLLNLHRKWFEIGNSNLYQP
ncbi:MAG: transporter substrate-binding domain-containing protein [Pseudomonadota bacterium]